jgi:hypothetical protein
MFFGCRIRFGLASVRVISIYRSLFSMKLLSGSRSTLACEMLNEIYNDLVRMVAVWMKKMRFDC